MLIVFEWCSIKLPKEVGELQELIDKNLLRDFIQPAKSRMVAPVLF